jgi:tetratricopeptide (TPR) repeat protein
MAKRASLLTLTLLLAAAVAPAQVAEAELAFNQGLLHLREGRLDMAVAEFKQAIDKDKRNPYFQKALGLTYVQQGKYDDAIACFNKALEFNPFYIDVRNDLGTALILQGKREEGKREFTQAFGEATNPTPELSARNLGQAYFDEQNFPEALKWYQTAVKRNSKYPDAHLGLAASLLALNRAEEAVIQLESASNHVPDNNDILVALGDAYFKVGRFSEARARLEQVAKSDPTGAAGRRAADMLRNLPR